MPVLSVLTAAIANRDDLLVEAGESLLAQRLPDGWQLQWVVQEDGAEPGLADLVDKFPIADYAANGEQLGIATTRNVGLARVTGGLVHVLDCDDLLLPEGLATAIAAFVAHPDIHWVAGQADDLLPDGERVAFPPVLPPGRLAAGVVSALITEDRPLPVHPAGLTMRTATVRALGGWTASPRGEDNALLVAIAELAPGYLTHEVTWLYRKHTGQTTGLPSFPVLEPIGWAVVRQRLTALRAVGLHLGQGDRDPVLSPVRTVR